MLVDTHTHLYLEEFEEGGTTAVRRALDAGIGHMIMPNVDTDTIGPMKRLHAEFPEVTSMAMGLHPTEVGEEWEEALARTTDEFLDSPDSYVAIGEIGMDLYWDATFVRQQMEVLDRQLTLAREHGKPVIIHCRESLDPLLEVMEGHRGLTGVMHSFSGTPTDVDRVRRVADLYFGINGIVTFKNSKLAQTLPEITTERLLLETDSPYLAPVPKRGKRNESAYLVHTAAFVAAALGLTPEQTAAITTLNARQLFSVPKAGE